MEYLFWSQVIFWLSVLIYIYYLTAIAKKVEKQINSLTERKEKTPDNA